MVLSHKTLLIVFLLSFLTMDPTMAEISQATTTGATNASKIEEEISGVERELTQLIGSTTGGYRRDTENAPRYVRLEGLLAALGWEFPEELTTYLDGSILAGPQRKGSIATSRMWIWFFQAILAVGVFFILLVSFTLQFWIRKFFPAYKSLQSISRSMFLFTLGFTGVGTSLVVQTLGLVHMHPRGKWIISCFIALLTITLSFVAFYFFAQGMFAVQKENGLIKSKDDQRLSIYNDNHADTMYNKLILGNHAFFDGLHRVCSPNYGKITMLAKAGTVVTKGDVIGLVKGVKTPNTEYKTSVKWYYKAEKYFPSGLKPSDHAMYCGIGTTYKFHQSPQQAKEKVIAVEWEGEDVEVVWSAEDEDVLMGSVMMLLTADEEMKENVLHLTPFEVKRLSLEISQAERQIGWELYESESTMVPSQYFLFAMIQPFALAFLLILISLYIGGWLDLQHCHWDDTLPDCKNYVDPSLVVDGVAVVNGTNVTVQGMSMEPVASENNEADNLDESGTL